MVLRTQQRQQETSPLVALLGTALAALANPVRLRIILMLREREQCVCHLTDTLGLTKGTVSYHMGVLKQAGLIQDRRDPNDARWIYYRLNPTGAAAFQTGLSTLLDATQTDPIPANCCD